MPLHQQCKEEPNKERQGVGVLQEGKKKKKNTGKELLTFKIATYTIGKWG